VSCAYASLVIGSIGIFRQISLKRIWAYSSLANMGLVFVMIGFLSYEAATTMFEFLIIYIIVSFCFFGILALVNEFGVSMGSIYDLRKVFFVLPSVAFCFVIALFSLAGIPPLAGWYAKFFLIMVFAHELVIMPALVIIIMIALLAFLYLVLITLVSFYKDTDVSISLTNSFSEVATRFEFSTIVYIIVAFNIIFIINAMVFSNAFSMFVLQNLSLYFVGYSNLFVLIFRTLQRFFYNLFFFSNPVFLIVQLTILFLVLIFVGFHGFAFELLLVIETNDFSVILQEYKPLLERYIPDIF